MNITRKTIGSIVGSIIVIVIVLLGKPITYTIEAHPWVGVILLIGMVAFSLWECFGEKKIKPKNVFTVPVALTEQQEIVDKIL